ncbi:MULTISPECIES: alpha/beta fold hydrolase [Nocardia]|uniref:alpha/beta fold hydrolase n=1 Tax=Nocardia TaxID=1817 RepID=UPI000BF1C327|nr:MULTISPECIES: alpha/beta fold hydrolase [Nocardia]MBF6186392.1 alpha/beta fold hydrolase [Nocardia farcinica]MBF6313914.1 alpha/beta fold hydrolase [Nocardia farcinica]MBF6409348.1 alpha/beta fold hydrolase [Nocardia farcinica]PEH74742.1 alpha/beta hydrolase [Nocardia sp. FDAARGOS_372]UEX24243.1 alpha/beta hydrolase [Nocardia farcinica]
MAGPDVRATRIHRLVRRAGVPDIAGVPGGREIELPGRGSTYVVDIPGPAGAPALILLHGTASTALLNWFPALEGLSERFRVILFDQRWHGRGIRSRTFRLDDCADDVVAVADALDVPRAVCVGYSLGGAVALTTAHRHPDRVAGLVLCATPYRFREKWREKAFHQAFGALADVIAPLSLRRAEKLLHALPEVPEQQWAPGEFERWALAEFRSTSGWALTQVIAEVGRFDATPWLHTLDLPTAVVITTRDRAIPVYRQLEMATMIPGATIHLARTGHTGCVFGADRFVPAVLAACDSVADRL